MRTTNNDPQLNIAAVMPRCSTCNHWKQNTFYDYEGVVNDKYMCCVSWI